MVIVEDALLIDIIIDAVGISIFTSKRKIALPQRTAHHQLGGIKGILVLVITGDTLLLCILTRQGISFAHILQYLPVRPKPVGIEVDIPVAHLPVIVNIQRMAGSGTVLPACADILLIKTSSWVTSAYESMFHIYRGLRSNS